LKDFRKDEMFGKKFEDVLVQWKNEEGKF